MSNSSIQNKPSSPVRQPVLLGLFTGTAIGVGYVFAGVPNVELMSLIIALCGGVLGARLGLLAGALAATVYSLGSPYGLPVPIMLIAQAIGLGAAGVFGAWGGNRVLAAHFKQRRSATVFWAVLTGLVSTLIYDLLTNLAIIGAFDTNATVVMTGAVPFMLLHAGSNIAIFAALFPTLLPRLAGLNRAALVGRSSLSVLALMALLLISGRAGEGLAVETTAADSTAASVGTAAPDSTVQVPEVPLTGPGRAFGWQRDLWQPFSRTAIEWLGHNTNRAPVVDGGLGAPSVVLGEAGTSWNPQFVRDGVPMGTGHILADDPWLVPTAGQTIDRLAYGRDNWGGTGGVVSTRTEDPDPQKAVSAYAGIKGKHETYFRSIYLLTPKAAWRAAFEFEESLDVEGYNYTELPDANFMAASSIEFPGHSRVRQSRTRVFRQLDADNLLTVEYGNGRLTKDSLPAYGAEHLELWDDSIAVKMKSGRGAWQFETLLFWRNRDLVWGDRSPTAEVGVDSRKLETGREGATFSLRKNGSPTTGLDLQVGQWTVDDSLLPESWLDDFEGTGRGDAHTARMMAHAGLEGAGLLMSAEAGADWHSLAGLGPEVAFAIGSAAETPWWTASVSYGGRAPRSDELLTPLRRDVAGRKLSLFPNADLEREETGRAGLILQKSVFGFDLALDGSLTSLRNGITWQVLPDDPDAGQWQNALAMDSSRLTGSVARQGRFLGWVRIMLEGTWQKTEEKTAQAAFLPPERYLRSHLMWENHFFQEDGILQIALLSTRQGAMADPWDVSRLAQLPERTVHDLLLGFRLAGAHLSLGLMNLTGERSRLTSGALSTGQEVDMRLHWAWVY